MIKLTLKFETEQEMKEYLHAQNVKSGVSDWLEETRAKLKYSDSFIENEYQIIEQWRLRLVELINSYTFIDI